MRPPSLRAVNACYALRLTHPPKCVTINTHLAEAVLHITVILSTGFLNMVTKYSSSEIAKGYMDEDTLRKLAVELARDIHEPDEILKSLGLTEEDYQAIKNTRAFQTMFNAATAEWNAAGNTQKRAKLKAAAMTEESLEYFMQDIQNREENLNARVGLLNTLARIGGLGNPEPVNVNPAGGQFFKLEIHLQGRDSPIVIDGEASGFTAHSEALAQSALVTDEDYDDFS